MRLRPLPMQSLLPKKNDRGDAVADAVAGADVTADAQTNSPSPPAMMMPKRIPDPLRMSMMI